MHALRTHTSKRIGPWAGALLAAGSLAVLGAGPAFADIPVGQPVDGTATFYTDAGYGACGTPIDASRDMLAAVPASYWTTPNSNDDPLCQGVSVQVTYNGTTITVPVADKCPSCDPAHIDLSAPAFQQLADPGAGVIGVSWQFVRSGAGSTSAAAVAALNTRHAAMATGPSVLSGSTGSPGSPSKATAATAKPRTRP